VIRSVSWCYVSEDVVTPFCSVTDNPSPFVVTDHITPYTELAVHLDVLGTDWPFLILLLFNLP